MDDLGGFSGPDSGSKPKRPFLKRGEGVEKRVFASKYRRPPTEKPSKDTAASGLAWASQRADTAFGGDQRSDTNRNKAKVGSHNSAAPNRSSIYHGDQDVDASGNEELPTETHLLSSTGRAGSAWPPPAAARPAVMAADAGNGNRFIRSSAAAAWASRQAEEELELEEFRALETQIKADVVGSRQHAGPQDNSRSRSLQDGLSGPADPLRRSYAAQHLTKQAPAADAIAGEEDSWWSVPPRTGGNQAAVGSIHDNDPWAPAGLPRQPSGGGRPPGGSSGGGGLEHTFGGRNAVQQGAAQGSSLFPGASTGWGDDAQSAADQQTGAAPSNPWLADEDETGLGAGNLKATGSRLGFDDADSWNDSTLFPAATGKAHSQFGSGAGVAAGGRGNRPPKPQQADHWLGKDEWGGTGFGEAEDQELPQAPSGAQQGQSQALQQPFVRALFGQQATRNGASAAPSKAKAKAAINEPSAAEIERLKALEEQMASVATEKAALVRMRTELEKAANRLEQEKHAWEKQKAEDQARWEAQREAEAGKLRRDRRVLEQQSKALLKLPNKKERTAMEAAEAALEAERRDAKAREARHKLTVERLRRQIVELQEKNHELREEVRWHEQQQVERGWGAGSKDRASEPAARPFTAGPGRPAGSKPSRSGPAAAGGHSAYSGDEASAYSQQGGHEYGAQQLAGGRKRDVRGGASGPASCTDRQAGAAGISGRGPPGLGPRPAQAGADRRPPVRQHAVPKSWWDEEEQSCGEGRQDAGAVTDTDARSVMTGHGHEYAEEGEDGYGAAHGVTSGEGVDEYAATAPHGSPLGFAQHDDAEVPDGEDGPYDGADADSLAALAWQQHQSFMAQIGVPPDNLVTQPVHQGPGAPRGQPQKQQQHAGPQANGGSRPQQPPHQQQPGPRQHAAPDYEFAGRPQGAQNHATQPNRSFEQGLQEEASFSGRPAQPAGNGGRTKAGAAGPSGQWGPAARGGPGAQAQDAHQQHQRAQGSGPHRGPGAGAAGQGPSFGSAGVYDEETESQSFAGLNGVNQTLAVLRLDRQPQAAVAAEPQQQGTGAHGFGGGTVAAGVTRGTQPSGWGAAARQPPQGAGDGMGAPYGARQQQAAGHSASMGPGPAWLGSNGSGPASQAGALGGSQVARPAAAGAASAGYANRSAGAAQQQHLQQQPMPHQDYAFMARTAAAAAGQMPGPGIARGPQQQQQRAGADSGADAVVQEVRNAGGKLERTMASGKRVVEFANGTRKVALPSGASRVYFHNGDIKWAMPAGGPVHYYYAEVNTWHTTYPEGVEVFYFPSGQNEAHHPDGTKEILFPDGMLRLVLPSGEEVDATWQQMSWILKQPQPSVDQDAEEFDC